MTPDTITVHEQMIRHFRGIVSTLDQLLKDLSAELKEIKAEQTKHS